ARTGLVARTIGRNGAQRRPGRVVGGLALAVAAIALPYSVRGINLVRAQNMLAFVVIFASVVCITGFCGYLTLGQAGFAGFGAYLTGRMVNSAHLPVVVAMVIGGVGAMV